MEIVELPTEHAKRICDAWALGAYVASSAVWQGVLNCNHVLQTASGLYFIKSVRPKAMNKIPAIYGVESWFAENCIPAVVMRKTAAGELALGVDGHLYTLYPFIEGEASVSVTERGAREMGMMLGKIHLCTERGMPAGGPPEDFSRKGKDVILDRLREHRERILQKERNATDELFLGYIDLKLSFADKVADPHVPNDTIIHGDYHRENVLFRGDDIVGICDWEKTAFAPRSFEVARSLFYTFFRDFDDESRSLALSGCFLEGYLTAYPTDAAELRRGFLMKAYRSVCAAWIEEMYYHMHSDRANKFVESEMEILKRTVGGDLNERILASVGSSGFLPEYH